MTENTFGNYEFEDWIPETTRVLIREFWGCFGRTYKDWIESNCGYSEFSIHGPGPNGFRLPKTGMMADFILTDYEASKKMNRPLYKIIRGRYIHHWNNVGSIVDEFGEPHHVSSCDRWVRVLEQPDD